MEQKALAKAMKESKKLQTHSTQPTLMETIVKSQPYEKKGSDMLNRQTLSLSTLPRIYIHMY